MACFFIVYIQKAALSFYIGVIENTSRPGM